MFNILKADHMTRTRFVNRATVKKVKVQLDDYTALCILVFGSCI